MTVRFRDKNDPLREIIENRGPALVVGMGRSGIAAANLLYSLGCPVTINELMDRESYKGSTGDLDAGVKIAWGGHPEEVFEGKSLIVLSPGVPPESLPLGRSEKGGPRVVGEMELAFRLSGIPWVAVTGTNGKSTTTTLIGEFAKAAGVEVLVGGNLGTPAGELVQEDSDAAWLVAEVSSFQLETIETFRPSIAALLNISPDHLDRYPHQEAYIRAKSNMFLNMRQEDEVIINADDPLVVRMTSGVPPRAIPFTRTGDPETGVALEDGWIVIRDGQTRQKVIATGKIAMTGTHNLENCLAAVAVGWRMGIDSRSMAKVMRSFPGLEHRMELVGYIRGVPVYNDSKGTNVGATVRSLEGFSGHVILILGGRDKGTPFDPLREPVSRKVGLLILVGEAAGRLQDSLSDTTETIRAPSLEKAVKAAIDRARPGSVILFSPACSSFDMFGSFEERGRVFKRIVHRYLEMN
jgi:UDP-N-acetylmuramoylalanine--D-glutamate ligase